MAHDMEIIKQIEKQTGEELKPLPLEEIKKTKNGYALDKTGQVQGLNLDGREIGDISFLRGLSGLTHLSLINNQITDLTPLSALTNLTTLDLRKNKITGLTPLSALTNLTELYLCINRITGLTPLMALTNLTTLDLSYNKITGLRPLSALANLTILDLDNNQITDLTPLSALTNLANLWLNNNQLTGLTPLMELKHLNTLSVCNNLIRQLPPGITSWWPRMGMKWENGLSFDVLNLYGNPLTDPPAEIVKQGKTAIKAYFDSLNSKKDTLPLNEVKVLLVGDGAAGKTSLVNRLLRLDFNISEPQTHGINIKPWTIQQGHKTIKAHLWDFGGQEIMHATHQFFLSKRSLYLLVLDGRKDEKTEYWLKHIESFGGDSPVLAVINKTDENPGFELNRKFLQEKYPNLKSFYRVSCKTNEGFDALVPALEKALSQVEMIRTTWAASWFQVKTQLENMKEPFLSYRQYRQICSRQEITDKTSQDTLVDFLNDLGVILHFKDLELHNTHVLDPKWATEAVYKIINSKQLVEHSGVLKLDLLEEILKPTDERDYDYPPDKYPYIIELMIKFELCYRLDGNRVLIPNLLAAEECLFEFDYDTSLKFIIDYDFLPPSVMPRFIVRMHRDIKDWLQWRTGVVLTDKAFHATAVVKCDERERRIFIYVNGEQKRDYFSIIRKTIRDINGSFEKLETKELVPLPDNDKITVEYEELTGYEAGGKSEIYIGKLRKGYSVTALLDGIASPETRKSEYEKIPHEGGDIHVHFDQQIIQTVKQETNIQIAIDIKVDLPALKADFFKLKEELEEMAANNPALAKELAELAKVEDGLDELTLEAEKKELAKPLHKLGRLLEKMGDKDSKLSKILEGTKKGVDLAQKVGRTYNKFAQWLALPQVPDIILGKK